MTAIGIKEFSPNVLTIAPGTSLNQRVGKSIRW